jgi:hypothetical protein
VSVERVRQPNQPSEKDHREGANDNADNSPQHLIVTAVFS